MIVKNDGLGLELKSVVSGGIRGIVRLSATGARLPDAEIRLAAVNPEVAVTVLLDSVAGIKTLEARAADGAWRPVACDGKDKVTFDLAVDPGRQAVEVKVVDVDGVETAVSRQVTIT